MSIPFALLVASTVSQLPVGVEVDCSTYPGGVATTLTVTVTATDGTKNVSSKIELGKAADAEIVQALLVVALEQEGWTVKAGSGRTVLVFAPKGKSVASIRFDSDGWVPVYRLIPAADGPKAKPKK